MYVFLNEFFFVFHSLLIIFILCGWAWKKTRRLNLIVISLTAFSWFILGIWYGYGYCPSTDWHWQVRMKLGYMDMPSSYIEFLVESLTGWNVSRKLVDVFALALLVLAFAASLLTNVRNRKRPWRSLI
jgi:hypothetical protein